MTDVRIASSIGSSGEGEAAMDSPPGIDFSSGATPEEAVAAPDVRAAAGAAAVRHLFEQTLPACAINLVVLALVGVALHGHVPPALLLGWGSAVVALTAARFAIHRAYRRTTNPEPRFWARRYLALVAPSGLAWGLAIALFVPLIPPMQVLVIVVAVGGLTAGALPMHAAVLPVYLGYIVSALVPTATTFVLLGGTANTVLALMTFVYAGALTFAGRAYNRNLSRASELTARLDAVNRELQRRVSRDPLTGLWNRQRLESALDAELDRVARYGSWCSLIMLDVDHFKQVNDNHGHDVGDHVLTQIGQLMDAEMRAPDHLARWGGEEFMALLPETGATTATAVAERLRRRVAEATFADAGQLTISLGVTTTSGREERSTLLKHLDDALYRAKQDGRNCVRLAQEPTPAGSAAMRAGAEHRPLPG